MEQLLIQRILAGDRSQFSYFVKRYQDMAFTLAFRMVGDHQDAEDVVQDAFVKAFESLSRFELKSAFSTWFYKIVVNTSLSKIRHKKVRRSETTEVIESTIPAIESRYMSLSHKEQTHYANLALQELKAEDSALLTLYYFGDNSIAQIAEIIDRPVEHIKVQIHRARKRMYASLDRILGAEKKDLLNE